MSSSGATRNRSWMRPLHHRRHLCEAAHIHSSGKLVQSMSTSRSVLRLATAALLVTVLTIASAGPAQSADSVGIGQRYNDGLDSRHATSSFVDASKAVGYGGRAWNSGRDATSAWTDMRSAAIVGFFGHANAGVFQVDEGATNDTDQFIGAGFETDVVSQSPTMRWWGEYLPYADVDDVKLAVLAGCYTSKSDDYFGKFADIGARKGVDAVIGFNGLVYYPSKCTDCAYSGNYFWQRFSLYARRGNTISVALDKGRTDLIAKEGSGGGWGTHRIGGSVASPGSVRLDPADDGEPATSQPLGMQPYSLSSLSVSRATQQASPLGGTTEYDTTAGVSYRRLTDSGKVLDVTAPASYAGDVTLGLDEAEVIARDFVTSESHSLADWRLTESSTTAHADGQELASFEWRTLTPSGVPGAESTTVEVDRRTGAVTYLNHVWANPRVTEFRIDRAAALEVVARLVDVTGSDVTAARDVWDRPRWTVTVDRGLDGLTPDVDRIVVDGSTGEVVFRTTA